MYSPANLSLGVLRLYLLGILVCVVASAPVGAVEGKCRCGRGTPALVSFASVTADSKLEPGIKQS